MTQPHVHTIEQPGGLEDPNSLVLGNHDEIHGMQKKFCQLY
jgi:hypothetical protein